MFWEVSKLQSLTIWGRGRAPERRCLVADGIEISYNAQVTDWTNTEAIRVDRRREGDGRVVPGGWIMLRRAGAYVTFLPVLRRLRKGCPRTIPERNAWRPERYSPPGYLIFCGAPLFTADKYEELRDLVSLPRQSRVPKLTQFEAVMLLQYQGWEVFDCRKNVWVLLLGEFPGPVEFPAGAVLCASTGRNSETAYNFEMKKELSLLKKLLDVPDPGDPVRIRPIRKSDQPTAFFFDGGLRATLYRPYVESQNNVGLLMGSHWVAEREG